MLTQPGIDSKYFTKVSLFDKYADLYTRYASFLPLPEPRIVYRVLRQHTHVPALFVIVGWLAAPRQDRWGFEIVSLYLTYPIYMTTEDCQIDFFHGEVVLGASLVPTKCIVPMLI